jgi:hypothetical protein
VTAEVCAVDFLVSRAVQFDVALFGFDRFAIGCQTLHWDEP